MRFQHVTTLACLISLCVKFLSAKNIQCWRELHSMTLVITTLNSHQFVQQCNETDVLQSNNLRNYVTNNPVV